MDGLLLDVKDDGTERVFEMQNGVRAFTARLRGVDRFTEMASGQPLEARLTGVIVDLEGREGGALANPVELLLNSPADVVVLARPAWWTLNRLLTMAGILTAGLALALV